MSDMNQVPAEQAQLDNALTPEGGTGTNRRLLFVLGGAALVVAALGGFFLLHSGGSSGGDVSGVVVVAHPTTKAKPSASASPSAGQTVPPVYHGQAGRNPFKPLAIEAQVTSSALPTDTSSPAPTSGSGGTTPSAVSTYQLTVESVSVSGQTATFWVNGVKYSDVAVGGTFASVFRLDSVGTDSKSGKKFVTLTFGDVAQPGKRYEQSTWIFTP